MWNKRPDEESATKTAAPQPAFSATTPAPRAAVAAVAPDRIGRVGPSMTVKGEVYSSEELYVDGEIHGSIEMRHRLTVGPSGKIHANVKAKEVVVQGTIQGNVQSAEKIIIREKGSLVGDIRTAGIVIEDGAYFKGSIDITKPESSPKSAPEPVIAAAGVAS